MKALKDSILEKLDINKVNMKGDFPIDTPLKDVLIYLSERKYKQIPELNVIQGAIDNVSYISSFKNKCVIAIYKKGKKVICGLIFGDSSRKEISKDNPIFYIVSMDDKNFGYVKITTEGVDFYENANDFRSDVNKYLKI